MRLAWQSQAKVEFVEALKYYRDQAGLDIARDFNQAIMQVAQRLLEYPEMGVKTGQEQDGLFCTITLTPWSTV